MLQPVNMYPIYWQNPACQIIEVGSICYLNDTRTIQNNTQVISSYKFTYKHS